MKTERIERGDGQGREMKKERGREKREKRERKRVRERKRDYQCESWR